MRKNQDTMQPLKSVTITYNHEAIVIGSNLRAILYAFNNKLPLFYTRPQRPFRFDYLASELDISSVGKFAPISTLQTHEGEINVGAPKEALWERLLFILSLNGQAPLSTQCESMRYNGETLICSNPYSKIMEVEFEKAYYFGDDNCVGILEKEVAPAIYTCYDWIAFNRGGKHDIDLIQTSDDFVNQIWFYPSDRIDGNTSVKDACLVSVLTEKQLLLFDYSQTMARFKMIATMRDHEMRGLFNGYSPTGIPKYYKFRTTIIGRERRPQSYDPLSLAEQVALVTTSETDLLAALPQNIHHYQRILEHL